MRKTAICLFIAVAGMMPVVAQVAIEKNLPVSFGVDSRGGNRLEGRFIDARVYSRAWTAGEAAAYNGLAGGKTTSVQQHDLASFQQGLQSITDSNLIWSGTPKVGDRCDAVGRADFTNGFTFACWVVLNKTGGRLIDNATPGGYDGWIIDTYGGSVRFFRPGGVSTRHPLRLETGKPQCIVVTVTDDDGITIWQNGERHRVGYRNNQRYTPIAGGYEITDGEAVFSRVLYGWHGNDWKKVPRIFVLTSDRPRVRLLANPSRRPLGEVSFDCSGRVRYRYVFGRAEYELEGRGRVRMARSAVSEDLLVEVTGDIPAKISGNVAERGRETRDGKTYYAFNRADTQDKPPSDLPKAFDDAVARLEGLSRTLVVNTPDKELDSVILCENIAMDGVREGDCLGHAALCWRDPFPGWRVSYGLIALGRDEAFRAFARAHFSSQTKEGRVTSNMGMRDSIYSFNEPFVDAVLRYWLRSGDDDFMRDCAYEGVKRHLAYMEKYIRVPGTDLYENFLNAWNTDDKWCNGGAGTIASAYARFAYRIMARAAERFGRKADAAAFAKRADEIDAAIDDSLWSERRGVWGEYREKFGLGRLIDCPDSSSIYTAIDSGLADAVPSRAFRALDWYMKNVPSEIGKDGQAVIYSSNKLPRYYSSCGLYQEENLHLALACWQAGEPEIAWRHYRSAYFQTVRGEKAGPGAMYHVHERKSLENTGNFDFTDSLAMHLRSTVEGLFGIVIDGPSGTATVTPGFPSHWNEAEVMSPYFGYRWTRKGGVEVTHNPHGYKVDVRRHSPRMVGANLPPPHTNWGQPKGEGCDLSVPEGTKFAFVDLGAAANQNLRTLHARTYTPMTGRFPWCTWGPSTRSIEPNGRSWWIQRAGGNKFSVPGKFDIPADGIVRSGTGIPFKLDARNGTNAVFTSLYDQLPAMRTIPLSGKGTKIAFLVAVSTNPNIAWTEAARITVTYVDGVSESVSLVPPDNCDDWLNYGKGNPYHLKGDHIQLAGRAHVNVIAIPLDPSKELSKATIECRATETLAGIAAATLCLPAGDGKASGGQFPRMNELVDFSRVGHGWRAQNHVANARQTATGYAFDVTDVDPWCVSGAMYKMPPPPPDAVYIRIELETAPIAEPHSFQMFWHGEKRWFNEQEAVLLKPVVPAPCSMFAADIPAGALGSGPLLLRIDPPAKSATFTTVEYRRLRVSYVTAEWTPRFSAPPPLALPHESLVLRGDGWELRHGSRMGAFAFLANGKTWAEGYPNEPFVIKGQDGKPETLDWKRATGKIRIKDSTIAAAFTMQDASGRTWTWSRTFTAAGTALNVRTAVAADRPAEVYHIPYLTLFVDRASNGHKRQALLPGIEYLADEPSSNEKEVRGPQANRLIPAAHKFCYPMMALADASSWFALEWGVGSRVPRDRQQSSFAPVFDTPDRLFKSGGHLFALWAPGIGAARHESDTRLYYAAPFTSGAVETTLSTGAGGDVTDALTARYPLAKLPPTPALDAARSCDVLARGWLDSGIRDGAQGCRHALGRNWPPKRVADVPALMLWLASATPDAATAARLTKAANEMIAALPENSAERKGWGGSVSHVRRPAAPLVFGDPIAYARAMRGTAKDIARQIANGKRIWRTPENKKRDYCKTLGADHCNGYTSMSVSGMLSGALWTGDEKVIADALAVLDKFTAIYGNDVPRGAQPWEMPLHTPDILAAGNIVSCYVKGYLLSGNSRYLERARYWARTGMTMIYFVDPPTDVPNPVGRYATIGVIGATNWVAPNWIGLPVQWCGLVYSAALADLAEVETDAEQAALWRHLARGITASGVDQSYLPSDGMKVGLLPDSFALVSQVRRDPPINPGTVQENVSNFIGLPYYRVIRACSNTLVHVPGRVTAKEPQAGELARVEITAWPKAPYKVLFSRIEKPSAVKVNGASVPFTFQDNVMSVTLKPSAKPVLLALER